MLFHRYGILSISRGYGLEGVMVETEEIPIQDGFTMAFRDVAELVALRVIDFQRMMRTWGCWIGQDRGA